MKGKIDKVCLAGGVVSVFSALAVPLIAMSMDNHGYSEMANAVMFDVFMGCMLLGLVFFGVFVLIEIACD